MRILILITFVFFTQSVSAQMKYTKSDSAEYLSFFEIYKNWGLDNFSSMYNFERGCGRFTFLTFWLFLNNQGKACFTRREFFDEEGNKMRETIYNALFINADNCKSIFGIPMPNRIYGYEKKYIKLVEAIGTHLYNHVLDKRGYGAVYISIQLKGKILKAYIFKTKRRVDFEDLFIADIE